MNDARFAPLFARMDAFSGIVAIEGSSASGKTTLSRLLQARYGCTVVHMDDFFLPKDAPREDGNIDRTRFLTEVLLPLGRGDAVQYRRFDCKTQTLLPPIQLTPTPITVVEGAYSMHPEFREFYDLTVFLTITKEEQRRRVLARPNAEDFFKRWIPMEEAYFRKFKIEQVCDMKI